MSFTLKRNNFNEDALRVNVEEVANWIPLALGLRKADDAEVLDGKADENLRHSFFEELKDGITLCRLAEQCAPHSKWPNGAAAPVSDVQVPYNAQAKPGSFQARDNVAKFLEACKTLGVPAISLFSTEDLMARKNDKQVVTTLLALAKIGARNGVSPPRIVQYELDIEAIAEKEAGSDEEETEMLVAERFGLTPAELEAIQTVFDQVKETDDDVSTASRQQLVEALAAAPKVQELRAARPEFDKMFENSEAADKTMDLVEFLNWFRAEKKVESKEAKESRPRGPSVASKLAKPKFAFLPYVPKQGDKVDEALAEVLNTHSLDIRVRRIAIRNKKTKKVDEEAAYRFGTGSQPKVHLRVVRDLLMVRLGNKWEDVVTYVQRKLGEE